MYQLVSALAKPRGRNGRWLEVDLSQIPLSQIYVDYSKAILILSNDMLSQRVSLDIEDIRDQAVMVSLTPNAWFATLGNKSLPTSNTIPELKVSTVKYSDAWYSNYNVQLADRIAHPNADLPNSEKEDLLVTRANTDYELFYKNCLVTVNGLVHRTQLSGYGIYVDDGATSMRLANDNQIGIISFREVAEIEIVPIKKEMIYRNHPDLQLGQRAYVNLDRDLNGKTVLLVLGGYLHLLDNAYRCVGDSMMMIDFAYVPLAQRYYHSKRLIDLSSMGLSTVETNPELVSVPELFGDPAIEAYLTLSQSFFVIVDTPELFVERHKLENTKLPGRFISNLDPIFPLENGLGQISEYWKIDDDERWVIATKNNVLPKYQFEETHWKDNPAIDDSRITTKPIRYNSAFMLEIGRDL